MQSSLRSMDLWTGKVQKNVGSCSIIQLLKECQKEKEKVGKIYGRGRRREGGRQRRQTDREQNAGKEKELGIALGYRSSVPSTD